MIGLTRKTDYALVALAHLAQVQCQGRGAVSARHISEQFGLPLSLLMNLMKVLSRAGIVTSTRGAQGGYALASAPGQVTLKQILATIEGPTRIAQCCADDPTDCDQLCEIAEGCPIKDPIRRLQSQFDTLLSKTTLADLAQTQIDVPLDRVGMCSSRVS